MPRARKHLVCLADTPYYHVSSRCVRRAFLCGVDRVTGKSFEHRRSWIEDRVRVLSSLFSIRVCAYAIMSNHYHLVVKLCPEEPVSWTDDEVLNRWTSLYKGPLLVQRYQAGEPLSAPEQDSLRDIAVVYRKRLASLSWFMKCLNEVIARQANTEDRCTGHFWEARFHSQPLTTERALLTAMAYVDLNPIRAKIARTPEESEYTSVRTRIRGDAPQLVRDAVARLLERGELRHFGCDPRLLMPFSILASQVIDFHQPADVLPMQEADYLALVDATGRVAIAGKRGRIDPALAPILTRLGLTAAQWADGSTRFKSCYRNGDLRLKQSA